MFLLPSREYACSTSGRPQYMAGGLTSVQLVTSSNLTQQNKVDINMALRWHTVLQRQEAQEAPVLAAESMSELTAATVWLAGNKLHGIHPIFNPCSWSCQVFVFIFRLASTRFKCSRGWGHICGSWWIGFCSRAHHSHFFPFQWLGMFISEMEKSHVLCATMDTRTWHTGWQLSHRTQNGTYFKRIWGW